MEKTWLDGLKKLCSDLAWKNIVDIHSRELEFFIEETEWAITLIESEEDTETMVSTFRWQQARVMEQMLKTYIKRFHIILDI